jgi:hypothetical protein
MIRSVLLSLALTPLLAAPVPAQQQASTFDALCRAADWIVQARVVGRSQQADRLRVRFAAVRSLRGDGPETFELMEPAGPSCGRALFGLLPGAGCVAFLERDGRGLRLCASTSRALSTPNPALLAHLEALIDAGPGERLAALLDGLGSPDRRIADDAALALAVLPGLEAAPAACGETVLAALARGLAEQSPGVAGLLTATARCRPPRGVDLLLPWYLRGQTPEFERLLHGTLGHFRPADLGAALPAAAAAASAAPRAAERLLRIADLLEDRDRVQVLAALALDGPEPVRRAAQDGLRRRGLRSVDLIALGLEPERAAREPAAVRPRFRSIDPAMEGHGR